MLVEKVKEAIRLAKLNEYNAFIEVYEDSVEHAQRIEEKAEKGPLYPLILSIKNNIAKRGKLLTNASRFLANYRSPYSATAVQRVEEADGVIIGSNNMDEFACGNEGSTSAFGKIINPLNAHWVVGGSSGGSASAVSAGIVDAALGSDTGGSIRCPAAFTSIVGFKPSYGAISRHGLSDLAMSFDQIGVMAKDVATVQRVFNVIRGKDEKDPTTLTYTPVHRNIKRIAVLSQAFDSEKDVVEQLNTAVQWLKERGYEVEVVECEVIKYGVPLYYLNVFAEFSSAMQKFDGTLFNVKELKDWEEVSALRSQLLGKEVKRRILLGTFITSKENKEAWFKQAQQAREVFINEMRALLTQWDAILTPTMPSKPWQWGAKLTPLQNYLADVFTVISNLAGLPAISIPTHQPGVGMQFIAPYGADDDLLNFAKEVEQW